MPIPFESINYTRRGARALVSMLAASIALSPMMAMAQMQEPLSGGAPIDIQADEQEFGDDRVIARGKVKVVHGETIIRAPMATLFRDPAGQPKLAIFTGNPTLTQGVNNIRAAKLTFDIKEGKIIAEGNAHSEVMSNSMDSGAGAAAPPKKGKKGTPAPATLNPEDEPEEAQPDEPESTSADESKDTSADANAPKKPAESKPQKIITDSDKQEFEKVSGKFEAHGNVRVVTQGINVKSNHLKLVYGTDQKVEAVVFTGDVTAKRDANVTQADVMTYFLTTQRLQATGHVKSRVVQQKAAEPKKGGPQVVSSSSKVMDLSAQNGQEIIIISDAQDYNKDSGRVDAEGRVRLYYGTTVGIGPKLTVVTNEFGETDKVVFVGRSQITQPGRRWIADRITYTVEDNKVLAEGNTRAIIIKNTGGTAVASGAPAPKAAPPAVPVKKDQGSGSRVADDGRNKVQ